MAPVCEINVSSCRSRGNDSVVSIESLSVIVTSKHSLRDSAVGDPGLLGNTKGIDRNAFNGVKSLPDSKHYYNNDCYAYLK